ncbi:MULTISPECIES: UDP-N-acetylmuramate dehydrogenase [Actinomycetes]|uniref:UDP-N-acetylenolpyruvoylglucosamine reductase n=2 Tax=Actinomycetes TaxID=1760 RepID=A0ABP6LY93_9MICC
MRQTVMRRFSDHTTARVGGTAGEWVVAGTEFEALQTLSRHPLPSEEDRAASGDTLLVLGGGSNLLVADDGFAGTVLQLAFTGITAAPVNDDDGDVMVTVAAGHEWDDVVAWTVQRRYAGLEALSGIPGAAGATPVQNVGAYGAEVSQTLVDVRAWDRLLGEVVTLSNEELDFGYRDSMLKRTTLHGSPRYVVLSVRFRLTHRGEATPSSPVRYAELARSLSLDVNAAEDQRRAPLADVRTTVLALRAGKGMVLDPADHDTWSTGSFFTNPIVGEDVLATLPEGAPRFPALPDVDGSPRVKLSAAWLIDRAGCQKGFGADLVDGRASLSTKHTLAVTNRGDASTADLLTVAGAVRDRVREAFGIELHPEPVLIGCEL